MKPVCAEIVRSGNAIRSVSALRQQRVLAMGASPLPGQPPSLWYRNGIVQAYAQPLTRQEGS